LKKISVSDQLKEDCKFAIIEAGKIALNLQKKIKVKYKSKNQPVTNADIEINNFLFDFFKKKLLTLVGCQKNHWMTNPDSKLIFFGV